MRITRSGECGNSPKNAFVEDFIIDLITGEDLQGRLVEGAVVPQMPWRNASELTITHALSHGRVGAGNGVIEAGGTVRDFAIVLEFANTKGDKVRDVQLYLAE